MKIAALCFLLFASGTCASAQVAPKPKTTLAATPLTQETPEQLVQRQLDAYNARNLEAFVATYDEQVELLRFPAVLQSVGRAKLREQYEKFFAATPNLHCELVHRSVLGNKIIDHERVTGLPNGQTLEALAIYEVEKGLIRRVTFVQ